MEGLPIPSSSNFFTSDASVYLGAALLNAGQADEAVQVYRDDLKDWPRNGWSLFGLAQALEKTGHAKEAKVVANQFRKTWSRSDVKLSESRF